MSYKVRSAEYRAWDNMWYRCGRDKNYLKVKVCKRWKIFNNFLLDMGLKPSPEHTLERIASKGNYNPRNCRWATKRDQTQNRSTNFLINYQGFKLCASEWSRRTGLKAATIRLRISNGWTPEQALTTPPDIRRQGRLR